MRLTTNHPIFLHVWYSRQQNLGLPYSGRFRCTAFHMQRRSVRRQVTRMLAVPRVVGFGTHVGSPLCVELLKIWGAMATWTSREVMG